jgi:phage tail-like protein
MCEPVKWYDKFMFLVEIDGVVRAGFQTCSELAVEAANVEYKEGGRRHPHNSPGTIKFPEITLGRGATDDLDLYNWFKDTYDAAAGTGRDTPDIYRTFDVLQLGLNREVLEKYTVYNAYCRRYTAGDFDNNADEKRIEQVILQPDYWERLPK